MLTDVMRRAAAGSGRRLLIYSDGVEHYPTSELPEGDFTSFLPTRGNYTSTVAASYMEVNQNAWLSSTNVGTGRALLTAIDLTPYHTVRYTIDWDTAGGGKFTRVYVGATRNGEQPIGGITEIVSPGLVVGGVLDCDVSTITGPQFIQFGGYSLRSLQNGTNGQNIIRFRRIELLG